MIRKLTKIILLLLLLPVVSSCSHYHNVKGEVFFDDVSGKGKYVTTLSVNSSNTGDESLLSVQSKIIPIISAKKPIDDIVIESRIQGSVLYIALTFSFTDIIDFENKAEKITGNNYSFARIEGTDLFVKEITFEGFNLEEEDFSRWAVQAIDDEELFPYDNLVSTTSGQGNNIYLGNKSVYESFGNFVVYDVWKLNGITIENSISKELSLSRTLRFSIDRNSATQARLTSLDDGTVTKFFQQKADLFSDHDTVKVSGVKMESSDEATDFTVTFTSKLSEDIEQITEAFILGYDENLYISIDNKTKLVIYQDDYYGESTYGYVEYLVNPIHYVLKLGDYKLKQVDDEEYIKTNSYGFVIEKNTLSFDSNSYFLNLVIKYDTTRETMIIIFIVLGLAGLLFGARFLFYKANPGKLKSLQDNKSAEKAKREVKAVSAVELSQNKGTENSYKVIGVSQEGVVVQVPLSTDTILVPMENAYNDVKVEDRISYFTDGKDHYIQKL